MSEHKEFWDARFGEPGYAYGEQPNDFLVSIARDLAPGAALSLCEGEGRNAVYLARLGFKVTAVDFSEVGLAKAATLAARHGVAITPVLADLARFDIGAGRWDLVVSVFAQPPSAVRQALYARLAPSLRPGGHFVLEAKAEVGATGDDRYPGVEVLTKEITPLTIQHAWEGERQLDEGRYHRKLQRIVQIHARREWIFGR